MDQMSKVVVGIIGFAALVTACGVVWVKVIKPLAKFITLAETMVPLLQSLNETFKNNPRAFEVLEQMVSQFRTNGGSSLLDIVNRIDSSTKANSEAAQVAALVADSLRVGVETVKQLAALDRERTQEMVLLLDRLKVKLDDNSATGDRLEQEALTVKSNLAESHKRANEALGEPGAAADAAVIIEPEKVV